MSHAQQPYTPSDLQDDEEFWECLKCCLDTEESSRQIQLVRNMVRYCMDSERSDLVEVREDQEDEASTGSKRKRDSD